MQEEGSSSASHPNGIKLYILADEHGYMYNFWIYCGTQKPIPEIVMDFTLDFSVIYI